MKDIVYIAVLFFTLFHVGKYYLLLPPHQSVSVSVCNIREAQNLENYCIKLHDIFYIVKCGTVYIIVHIREYMIHIILSFIPLNFETGESYIFEGKSNFDLQYIPTIRCVPIDSFVFTVR